MKTPDKWQIAPNVFIKKGTRKHAHNKGALATHHLGMIHTNPGSVHENTIMAYALLISELEKS